MHPLNTFPLLLDFGRLAPFILRITIGIFIIYLGRERQRRDSVLSYVYYLCGLFLVGGYYTQLASIVGIAIIKFNFYIDHWINRKNKPVTTEHYFLYILTGMILISLIITGAGLWAFDMPF